MKLLWQLIAIVGGIYLLLCLYLYVMQDKLIFFTTRGDAASYQRWQSREYQLQTDNRTLHGWHVENRHIHNNTALIYFGGNAEDVIYNLDEANQYHVRHLFFTNYAGYGNSSGKPSEQVLYRDALEVFDQLQQKFQLDPAETFLMGRSLGAAVASHVASQHTIAGLILVTPFTSMGDLAARYYKLFPTRWLLKYDFNIVQSIKQSQSPLLLIAAARDEIMPADHIHVLQAASNHAVTAVIIAEAGHNNLQLSPRYYEAINRFILQTAVSNQRIP